MAQRPSFLKRQKEHARQEKQRNKAQRKQQRKADKLAPSPTEDPANPDPPETAEEDNVPPESSTHEAAG